MAMLHDICYSCFPACTAPDPGGPYIHKYIHTYIHTYIQTLLDIYNIFSIDLLQEIQSRNLFLPTPLYLIRYNITYIHTYIRMYIHIHTYIQVSYGHIHVAEAVCVPLHIMFPQPWQVHQTTLLYIHTCIHTFKHIYIQESNSVLSTPTLNHSF